MLCQAPSCDDWKKMAELLGDAAEAATIHGMVERLLEHALELWGADLAINERYDDHGRHLAYHMKPTPSAFIAGLQPVFTKFWPQHPYAADLLSVLGSGRISFLSDRISQRQFRDTGLWQEVYIHLRAKDQVLMGGMISNDRFWTLGLNRLGRDFGPRDRELGKFLQPRLTALFQRHARCEKAQWSASVLTDAHTPYLVVDRGGRVVDVSDGARELFAATGTPLPPNGTIPGLHRLRNARGPAGRIVRERLGELEILGTTTESDAPALVLIGRTSAVASASNATATLSSRESEILHWIGEGKTNAEIGVLLRISGRTVAKHCERLFEKLGVENRLSAALVSRRRD